MGRQQQESKKNKKRQQQEQEEQEEVQQSSQNQQGEDDEDEGDYEDLDIDQLADGQDGGVDGDQIILEKIQQKIEQCDDQEKLTWGAIYQIKKQQADLNEQMQQQIDAIKTKYEALTLPLMGKIADAVAGKKLQKSYYSQNEFTKSINLNKTKPKAIKQYWGVVFEGSGLIGNQDDIELLQRITLFKCESDPKSQKITLNFQFEDNQYVGNKVTVQVTGKIVDGNFSKKIQYQAKSKALDQNSMFGSLLSKDADDQQLYDTCVDLLRAYSSSTYFYFYQPQDDFPQDSEAGQEDGQNGQGEDEQSQQQDVQPVKKAKGSAITQKPECKQQ